MSYPAYTTPPGRPILLDPGVSPTADLLGELSAALGGIAPRIQSISNDWANLQAQNEDIAAGRWTVNNLVYQWGLLDPLGKAAVIAAGWLILRQFTKG